MSASARCSFETQWLSAHHLVFGIVVNNLVGVAFTTGEILIQSDGDRNHIAPATPEPGTGITHNGPDGSL